MFFVSTGGIRSQSAFSTALDFYNNGINGVELSGGAFSVTWEKDILELSKKLILQVHNYFPPPDEPFVFNLASFDPHVLDLSMKHIRKAIRLAAAIGRPIYSFHAGFRINPRVPELGKILGTHSLSNRDKAIEQFGENILILSEEARREGVMLLVENNVLSSANYVAYGEDPLLLTCPDEIDTFMQKMPSNVRLLLDVAHLKVSANTLNFDLVDAHEKIKSWIKAYHLSDNAGLSDDNEPVTSSSWFWDYLKRDLNYYSIEVYKVPTSVLISQYELMQSKIKNPHLDVKTVL